MLMLRLPQLKDLTANLPIRPAKIPKKVYIPLSQHIGKPCEPIVKVGDTVKAGQLIATLSEKTIFAPVHSSISGRVTAIDEFPHPLLGASRAIAIESDTADEKKEFKRLSQTDIDKLDSQNIRRIIADAGIVGMGGAGFPSSVKLSPPKPVDTFILNGAECEPYLTGDSRLMVEKTEEIILGLFLAARCVGAKNIYAAIEDNKPQAIEAFKDILGQRQIKIVVLKSQYPQGGEKQLIKSVLKKEVPSGKLPFDIGVVVHNVATVYAIYEAVYLGKPLYERALTVTGDCLKHPQNLLVRLGTTIKDLMDECGPLKKEPQRVVLGGPMMGVAQYSLMAPVVKSTNGIIFLSEGEIEKAENAFCIRCSRCVESCPLGLLPCMIALAVEKGRWDLAKAYGVLECMECGACNYVCPQRRNIVEVVRQAKEKLHR